MPEEHKLQVMACKYLKAQGILHFSVPNGGKRSYMTANYLKAEGLTAGVADLVVLLPKGTTVFLEFKAKKGKQQEEQKKFEKEVTELGFDYHVVKSFNHLVEIISQAIQKI